MCTCQFVRTGSGKIQPGRCRSLESLRAGLQPAIANSPFATWFCRQGPSSGEGSDFTLHPSLFTLPLSFTSFLIHKVVRQRKRTQTVTTLTKRVTGASFYFTLHPSLFQPSKSSLILYVVRQWQKHTGCLKTDEFFTVGGPSPERPSSPQPARLQRFTSPLVESRPESFEPFWNRSIPSGIARTQFCWVLTLQNEIKPFRRGSNPSPTVQIPNRKGFDPSKTGSKRGFGARKRFEHGFQAVGTGLEPSEDGKRRFKTGFERSGDGLEPFEMGSNPFRKGWNSSQKGSKASEEGSNDSRKRSNDPREGSNA